MLDAATVERVVREVLAQRLGKRIAAATLPAVPVADDGGELPDIGTKEARAEILVKNPRDPAALRRMKNSTPARSGIGRSGARLNTRTLLLLRADHADARDAVLTDVDAALLDRLGLFTVQSLCRNRDEHLTRPDLGRQFAPETLQELRSKCKGAPQVQVYASDGLSATAVNDNLENFLPSLSDGLKRRGIEEGTRFFLRFGRVPSMNVIGPALGAEVVCLLIGERPGLGNASSMSAYLCYRPEGGMPEARRTVVSNIHAGGIPAVEAGAYVAEVIGKILEHRKSGVDLKL